MKTIFLILTIGLYLLSLNVSAEVYISVLDATRQIFPDYEEYEVESYLLDNQEFKVYTVLKNNEVIGWTVVIDEKGKIQPITFLVGIGKQGKVLDVYVLEFRDLFGSEIKRRSFLRQFRSKSLKDSILVGRDIDAVTQATFSSQAAAQAVRKSLRVVGEVLKGF